MKTAKVKPAVNQGYKMRDPTLIEIANKVKATPAQVLVAFSLARDIVPLPKSANTKHQKENLEAVNVKLSAEQVERLLALDEYYVTDWDPTETRTCKLTAFGASSFVMFGVFNADD
ncbi:NADP-dependent oxidoreductase domain [Phytophthora cactorum]|nr:NADP-dependent oxidoreductase domain [Phytophthora cactorum]